MRINYSDEFKIEVIRDYYTNDLGVRMTAAKWSLPSKNYITKWEEYLKKKGLLPNVAKKPALKAPKTRNIVMRTDSENAEIRALRKQNEELKCALAYHTELAKLVNVKKRKI